VRTRANVVRLVLAQPAQLGRPVARVQPRAGAGVDRALVEALAQPRGAAGRSASRPSCRAA
jgi:hypothetical protein